jgi:hypothetical protein
MTGRRRSFLDRWAPENGMSVEEATKPLPEKAAIARYGEPEEIAGLMAHLVSKEARWLTGGFNRMDGGEIKGMSYATHTQGNYLPTGGMCGTPYLSRSGICRLTRRRSACAVCYRAA